MHYSSSKSMCLLLINDNAEAYMKLRVSSVVSVTSTQRTSLSPSVKAASSQQ